MAENENTTSPGMPASSLLSQVTLRDLLNSPAARLIGVLVGISVSVALGVMIVLWSQEPDYSLLYAELDSRDASEIVSRLQELNLEYKFDHSTGNVMVPSDRVHEVRIQLAGEGFPRSGKSGFSEFQNSDRFGISQFAETASYQYALENELARSISELNSVKSARVHLAVPRESAFVRSRKQPSASVVLNLYPGRSLEPGQINSVVNLVSSSISGMDPSKVTVVDQRGDLLSDIVSSSRGTMSSQQMSYVNEIESKFLNRISSILSPILGKGFKVQVTADVDFTLTEEASEQFLEDGVIRSEKISESTAVGSSRGGVPGSLSNQPDSLSDESDAGASPQSGRRDATRNYEVGKRLRRVESAPGSIRRLSVAVVVDHRASVNADGESTSSPLPDAELDKITSLVKEAVGFDEARGDSVQVVNSPFVESAPAEEVPGIPLWKDPTILKLAKQAGAGLIILALIFGVIRPAISRLTQGGGARQKKAIAKIEEQIAQQTKTDPAITKVSAESEFAQEVEAAKDTAAQDPKVVAQVVKGWIGVND